MGALSELLKWRTEVKLKDEKGFPIKDKNGKPVIVYMRIIGDKDLETALQKARLESAKVRASLRDPESDNYNDVIIPLREADRSTCLDLIRAARGANWTSEALSIIERPELPKIEEVASNPDAPTLEENEKFDALVRKLDEEYRKNIEEYVKTKQTALELEIEQLSDEQARESACEAATEAIPLNTFMQEFMDEKVWRSCYTDKELKIRGFSSLEDFRETAGIIKDQLIEAYSRLEVEGEDIKN